MKFGNCDCLRDSRFLMKIKKRKEEKNMSKKVDIKLVLIGIGVGLALILLAVFSVQGSQNRAIDIEEQVAAGKSDINVQEKRREDLLYNLVDSVKAYDKHEGETLEKVIDKRGSGDDISDVTVAISAVAEAYPELKSNENYKELMNELSVTENMIAEYRSNYNKQVKEYNRYTRSFPARLFLSITGYEKQDYQMLQYDVSPDAPRNLFGE